MYTVKPLLKINWNKDKEFQLLLNRLLLPLKKVKASLLQALPVIERLYCIQKIVYAVLYIVAMITKLEIKAVLQLLIKII